MSHCCMICCSWSNVSNVKSLLVTFVCVYVCMCVSSDDVAAYRKVEDREGPLPDGCGSAVSSGVVNYQTQWKLTGLRREATKDMYKNHKVIMIRIYLYMYTYSISIY